MSKINSKNFDAALTTVIGLFATVREQIQGLLDFAMVQASKGNYTYINILIAAGGKLKGISMNGIQQYVEKYCDVQLVSESGVRKFSNKKTKGFKFVAPTTPWYEDNNAGAVTVVDLDSTLKSLITRLTGVVDGKNKLKEGQDVAKVSKVLKALKAVA